uniref:Uncharacterized protein n=1 Tax=Siphoviridae sp. ct8Cp41 TaxID=2825358 RepID=A0A8S5UBI1_9CAUD|nr:MAG TPA: hypothetical protein [Siphoviridae sp. ct8Cp41]DAI02157.1 MAG TPA: hypothetical protein [Caudoviricetes sp.]DAQ27050.1 MAG TPA: hypothetical protein [Caudoviricetes sp.]
MWCNPLKHLAPRKDGDICKKAEGAPPRFGGMGSRPIDCAVP